MILQKKSKVKNGGTKVGQLKSCGKREKSEMSENQVGAQKPIKMTCGLSYAWSFDTLLKMWYLGVNNIIFGQWLIGFFSTFP